MATVIATERGHDGVAVREVGDEFTLNLDEPRFQGCTWFKPKDAPAAEVAEAVAPTKRGKLKASTEDDIA